MTGLDGLTALHRPCPEDFPEPGGGSAGGPILQGTAPDLFGRIRDPGIELVVWERRLSRDLDGWLARLPVHQLPDARFLVSEDRMPAALAAVVVTAGMPRGGMRDAFLQDLVTLTGLFMGAMGTGTVDIRLERIRHDACWRFHRDCVPVRLLTTYRGPGTEWVLPRDSAAAIARQAGYDGPLQRFPRHAAGLFKGDCGGPASGIVHRSPPIDGTGTVRLLLALNLPSAASPDMWAPA